MFIYIEHAGKLLLHRNTGKSRFSGPPVMLGHGNTWSLSREQLILLEKFDLQLAVTTLQLEFHQVVFWKEYHCSFVLLDLLPDTFHTATSVLCSSPMYRHVLLFILSSSVLSVIRSVQEIWHKKIQKTAENNRVASKS